VQSRKSIDEDTGSRDPCVRSIEVMKNLEYRMTLNERGDEKLSAKPLLVATLRNRRRRRTTKRDNDIQRQTDRQRDTTHDGAAHYKPTVYIRYIRVSRAIDLGNPLSNYTDAVFSRNCCWLYADSTAAAAAAANDDDDDDAHRRLLSKTILGATSLPRHLLHPSSPFLPPCPVFP